MHSPFAPFAVELRDGTGPVVAGATLEVLRRGERLPYHPILAEGLIRAFQDRGWVSPHRELGAEASCWPRLAPLLEDVWNRHAHASRPRIVRDVARVPASIVETTLTLAEAAGVRSFAQGLEAAAELLLADGASRLCAIASRVAGERIEVADVQQLVLEAVREGHVAGIVRARIERAGRAPVTFALNVARDASVATERLAALAADLRSWYAADPGGAAEVLDEGHGRIRWFGGEARVAIVATSWIDADELHVTRAGIHRVLEFLPGAGSAVPDIRGEILDERERRHVVAALAARRTRLAAFAGDEVVERELELNNGDVVITRELDSVLVGSAGRSWRGPLGAWPYRLAALSARDEHAPVGRPEGVRIWLGAPESALAAGLAAVPRELKAAMRAAARVLDPDDALRGTELEPAARTAVIAAVREEMSR